jgi:ATP-dependent helicase HrpB
MSSGRESGRPRDPRDKPEDEAGGAAAGEVAPISAVLPELRRVLARENTAVLVAPPGAGKTTRLPLAMMDEPWAQGRRVLVLEPRRLAARAAAEHMARSLGERPGETVGYRVRMEAKVSARTRVELVTEGVFTRMILDDPGLDGVAAVLFDEFHERSLEADLGLALARDAQSVLRDDLRLLVMSATLDGARIAARLGGAPVVESQGRAWPVETRYLGRDPGLRPEQQVARAILRALAEEEGSLLVFLPGQGEIARTAGQLQERIRDPAVDVAPLYGALDFADQRRAIAPSPPGRRKVVLATSIAETSLTIEGVRVVIDAGLARVPRFDPASGLTRLETVRVTQAAAEQRRGRAGRTGPGVCYRLWEEAETRALIPYGRPEILEAELSGLALDLARWGAREAGDLTFMDSPPPAALAEARALLTRLGALDAAGALTPHGLALARLPIPPRLAHMLLEAAKRGGASEAAEIAVLLSERGLGGGEVDLLHRVEALRRDRSSRARDAKALAARWARAAAEAANASPTTPPQVSHALLLAEAYPERIAKARGKAGEFQLVSGRGAWLDPSEALAKARWLAVGELGGGAARDRILLAAELDQADLRSAFGDRLETEETLQPSGAGRLRALRRLKLGALVLEEGEVDAPPERLRAHLLDQVRRSGLQSLPWPDAATRLRQRVAFLRTYFGDEWPDLSDAALTARVGDWLAPLMDDAASLSALRLDALVQAIGALVGWRRLRELDRLAPDRIATPAGPTHPIDYAAEGGPTLAVRVQELYGLDAHPAIAAGRVPLTLELLSPAHRPIQVTRDLPGFWRGSWAAVRAEMKGRYPKHPWPEQPWTAQATTRAKPRGR